MGKDVYHDYVKQLIVNRLRTMGCLVETEVFTPKSSKQGQCYRIDIVVQLNYIGKEIDIIELKMKQEEISLEELEKAKIKRNYAHKAYFCLPVGEEFNNITLLCDHEGIGLLLVNTSTVEVPLGHLFTVVESDLNKKPKKWDGLYKRLRDRYSYLF